MTTLLLVLLAFLSGAGFGRFVYLRRPLSRMRRIRQYRAWLARQPFGDGDPYRTVNRRPKEWVSMHVVKSENYVDRPPPPPPTSIPSNGVPRRDK